LDNKQKVVTTLRQIALLVAGLTARAWLLRVMRDQRLLRLKKR
jgi:hypothetical protein